MLIPSIDLKAARSCSSCRARQLAIRDDDVFRWVRRFEKFPKVQVIDLDAAMGTRRQPRARAADRRRAVVPRRRRHPHRRARARRARGRRAADHRRLVAVHATARPTSPSRRRSATRVGRERVIAAVDSRGGHVVIHGWKTTLPLTAVEAVRALEPYCDEFLYTHVDTEGLMGGTNFEAIRAVRAATTRRVTAAGGITTQQEIDDLHAPRRRRRGRHGDLHGNLEPEPEP